MEMCIQYIFHTTSDATVCIFSYLIYDSQPISSQRRGRGVEGGTEGGKEEGREDLAKNEKEKQKQLRCVDPNDNDKEKKVKINKSTEEHLRLV